MATGASAADIHQRASVQICHRRVRHHRDGLSLLQDPDLLMRELPLGELRAGPDFAGSVSSATMWPVIAASAQSDK